MSTVPETRSSPSAPDGAGDEIELGHVVGVFGFRGELRLHLHHRDSDLLSRPRDVVLVGPGDERRAVRLSARAGAGRRVIGRIQGVDDEAGAQALEGWRILIRADRLPKPQADEFYVWQVEGLPVFVGELQVGSVETVHETPGGDVFEIATEEGPVFVPSLRELVLEIDVRGGRVVLAPEALEGE